jgi:signal transduction histidine kinase
MVAPAAVGRAVLLGRAVATLTAAGAGLRLVSDPRRLIEVLIIVLVTTAAGLVLWTRNPKVVRHPVLVVVIDSLLVLLVLAVSRGGVAYFCCAAGASALAGVLLGMRALGVGAMHAALGYVVAAGVLHTTTPAPEVAAFVLAFPMADVLATIGAAVATAALTRHVNLSIEVVASAQRSAAASERARLARELHDSVTKTLRGVSFAALALPSSLRRHPALAEQLASTVSEGASAAAREARELLDGLRLDSPDEDFSVVLHGICRHWERSTGLRIQLTAADIDPPVAVRYELSRILQEVLRNVAQHARASQVTVTLTHTTRHLRLLIRDNGHGFQPPDDLSALRATNHYGIVGMHERAHTVGGTLRVFSAPGQGATIDVLVPITPPTHVPSEKR